MTFIYIYINKHNILDLMACGNTMYYSIVCLFYIDNVHFNV